MTRCLTALESEKNRAKALMAFSVALLVIALTPILALVPFNHPVCWDDFNALAELQKSPAAFSYGQRFSSQFCNTLFYPPLKDFSLDTMMKIVHNHRIFAFLYIILFVASFFFMVFELNRTVIKAEPPVFLCIFSASLFLLLNFINLSSTLFYCMPAATGYTGGVIFMFLFLALLLRHHFCASGKEKIICDALLFIVTFILSGFIEIFVLFAGFIAFYVFLFAKNPLSKKRDITYAGLFAFTILIFSSFFIVNKGMIAAKYDQKAQRTEASPSTQKPIASMLPATKTISVLAQNFVQLTVQTSAQSQPTKKSSTAKSFFQKNSSFFYRLGPWCKYNAKFVKQEIRKIVSFHNLPLMLFLFWILEKTPLKKTRVTIKTLFLIALLYPVILLMSLSGCYSGLSWFTLYVTVRNVFDVIFWLVTTTLLYALLKFAQQFVAATISLEFIPAHLDFTKAAAFALLAISLGLTSFGSEKYLVGAAWHDVLSGKAKKYDQIQSENYRTIFDSEESLVTLKYPGFPRALVNFQGNYIKFDSTDNTLYVSKEVVRFFKKHEIVYAYDELPSERDVYTQEKRR